MSNPYPAKPQSAAYTPKFAPGWLRSQVLAAIRRNGHKKLLNQLAKSEPKALLEMAIKLEPKDINTQTQVSIRVVSLPAKAKAGAEIAPAEYSVISGPSADFAPDSGEVATEQVPLLQ